MGAKSRISCVNIQKKHDFHLTKFIRIQNSNVFVVLLSGIKFYHEVGFLCLGLKNGTYTTKVKATANELNEPVQILDHEELKKRFPYLATSHIHEGIYTNQKSGHISPRNLVAAQKMAAKKAGCDVINDVVKRIMPIGSGGYEIEAEMGGQRIRTKKVLLATGSFTDSRDLLPKNLQPLVIPSSVTVLLVNNLQFNQVFER